MHLPYGVERKGAIIARFADQEHAETFAAEQAGKATVRHICPCGATIHDASAVRQGENVWCGFHCPCAPARTVDRWPWYQYLQQYLQQPYERGRPYWWCDPISISSTSQALGLYGTTANARPQLSHLSGDEKE